MPVLSEFATTHGVKSEQLVEISQSMALDPSSSVYAEIVNQLAQKWTESRRAMEAAGGRRKTRVYVPYAITSTQQYQLKAEFPGFDVRFTAPQMVSAACARAASLLVSEHMLTLPHASGKPVCLYGYPMRPMLMRNRTYAHLCLSGNDPTVQSNYRAEDSQVVAMHDSLCASNRDPPTAMKQYVGGSSSMICTSAKKCTFKANTGFACLDRVDTNFRQLAAHMEQHEHDVFYFMILGNKNMELYMDGPFDEVDGYVVADRGKVRVVFKDDIDFQPTYTHANYLELIARTTVVLFGKTFTKEYMDRKLGYLVYKITRVKGTFEPDIPPYKSWVEPQYKDKYLLSVPTLHKWGSADNKSHWTTKAITMEREVIDKIFDAAVLANVDKRDELISKRVLSSAFNYISMGQFTRRMNPMTADAFLGCIYAIFSETFMAKYKAGATVSAIAPGVRLAARSAKMGFASVVTSAISAYAASAMSVTQPLTSMLRRYQDSLETGAEIPLPSFSDHPGFIEYGDGPNSNKMYPGWKQLAPNPSDGFSRLLPTGWGPVDLSGIDVIPVSVLDEPVRRGVLDWSAELSRRAREVVSTFGEDLEAAYVVHRPDDTISVLSEDDVESLYGVTQDQVREMQRLHEIEAVSEEPVSSRDWSTHIPGASPLVVGYNTLVKDGDPEAHDEIAEIIVQNVLHEHEYGGMEKVPYAFNSFLAVAPPLEIIPGPVSADPVADLAEGLTQLFPSTQLMDTRYTEAERYYNPLDVIMRTVMMKLDVSKMEPLKPETYISMAIGTHVLPHIKENPVTVTQTLAKRNADTPYSVDPVSFTEIWGRVWKASLKVYYVDGAEQWLQKASPIGVDEVALREWLYKQDQKKKNRLAVQDDYSFTDVARNTSNMQLMLKAKLKPELDASYETSVKLPQSVQFDESGRSVALLSPIIRTKVKREQFLLKPNVLVMQMKSFDDMYRFANQFDWRPNAKGRRRYIEIDQAMFDKSQVKENADEYIETLRKFGVKEEYLDFIRTSMFDRSVSSVKGGVKMTLKDQNPSGAAFTLDRNNETSKAALAELILSLGDKVEFIMIMGDDVTIAVRGDVQIGHWERDLNRLHNLRSKVNLREHGYFCSYEIVHLPDGRTTFMRDPAKAALGLLQPIKDDTTWDEKWISFCDSMRHVGHLPLQLYLQDALYRRWVITHSGAKPETFALLLRAYHGFMLSKEQFDKLRTGSKYTIHY